MLMQTFSQSKVKEIIATACQVLSCGGLVVYPTETCYGLGADATNPQAIAKLLSYKRRREGKPLSILVKDKDMAEDYVHLNDSAKNLYSNFLPGPMTVISKSKDKVAPNVASELGTLGIRISSHPIPMALVSQFGKPITATSANASWQKKPYTIDDILKPLSAKQKEKLDFIIDGGTLPKQPASTVVDTTLLDSMVLRAGAIKLQKVSQIFTSHNETETMQLAQTLLLSYWNQIRKRGLLIALLGDLGSGKTIFTKGVGQFLQIKDHITSPSYTLVNEYPFRRHEVSGMLYHLDPWRLENFADFSKLELAKMLAPDQIVVVEWASKFLPQLKKLAESQNSSFLVVSFTDKGETIRQLTIAK